MNSLISILLLIYALFIGSFGLSCKLGRSGCIASCQLQNCATGYCINDVCTCSRCDKGSTWP